MATLPLAGLPQPSLFTLTPGPSGGRRALKGFEFQTAYISYALAGFAAGKEDLISCRIEAVEDLDALVEAQGTWVERYFQIKSKQEGVGRWTLNLLDREGVIWRFLTLFRSFRLAAGGSRRIELIFVADGDLDGDLVQLRDKSIAATEPKIKLFALLCSRELSFQDKAFEPFSTAIRDWCERNGHDLLGRDKRDAQPEHFERAAEEASAIIGIKDSIAKPKLAEAFREIAGFLDDFIARLRFESRVGFSLGEATFARLLESGDLSPDDARIASERLKRSVQDESTLLSPTTIDRSVLREWLGVPERALLQSKPLPSADTVERHELLDEISRILQTEQIIVLHGLSKIGKSLFASSLIDHDHRQNNYFWYSFIGDAGDLARLTKQLAVWVGENTGKWQIIDDLEKAGLQPAQAIERLKRSAIRQSYIVLDDCHKATDRIAFELLRDLACETWEGSRLILLSELKIPSAAALGAREIPVGGLDPNESILFAAKMGLELSDSALQFVRLALQVGGHPIMLRAIAKELPPMPSAENIIELGQRIPSIKFAQAFLDDLSNRIFFDLIRTPDQRLWLGRIAAVTFPVTRDLALWLGQLQPPLQISATDWNFLRSLLLDEIRADHYSVPVLLQHITGQSMSAAEKQTISVDAARYIFRSAVASRSVDFWDFQHALFALLGADCSDEAAMRFVRSFPSLLRMKTFKPFKLLFLTMNHETTHAKVADPDVRWLMLQMEVQLRVQAEESPDQARLYGLIRRMRVHLRTSAPSARSYTRPMLHMAIATVRMGEFKNSEKLEDRTRTRMFAALQAAIRATVPLRNSGLLANLLHFYEEIHSFDARPNVEVLKHALLQLRSEPLTISHKALIALYSRYASTSKYSDAAIGVLEAHSSAYRAADLNDAYFACEYAAAIILHDGRKQYHEARERLEALISPIIEPKFCSYYVARGLSSIGDTYWAESNYHKAGEYFEKVLRADLGDPGLHQIVCERFCDSLIFLGQYERAASVAFADLRLGRANQSEEQRARLYARIAYAYAENGSLRKAAIACVAVCRVSSVSKSDALNLLAGVIAGWVLGHITYSDPAIPESTTRNIRDSNALSDTITAEEIAKWRESDPFSTKSIVLAATIFELLRDWQRSEFLYRRALTSVLLCDTNAKFFHQTAYVYSLRLARVHIWSGKLPQAAIEFRRSVDHALDARGSERLPLGTTGVAAYTNLVLIRPALASASDEDVMTFFDLLKAQFLSDTSAEAWLLFAESEILFDRLAVQVAKKRLLKALELSATSGEHELHWLLITKRLFSRIQQFYGRQDEWIRDAVDIAVSLATDSNFARYQDSFAESVRQLVIGVQGPFSRIASAIKRLGRDWQEHAFWVVAYGLWRAATDLRLLSTSTSTLESILRKQVGFLGPSDYS